MSEKLVMELTKEQMSVMVSWCQSNGINYQVIGNSLVPPTLPTVSVPTQPQPHNATTVQSRKNDKDFPNLGTPTECFGYFTVYGLKVRYWENSFVADKVKYALKSSLKESGATWDKDNGCFVFHTQKDFKAWIKEQKARATK